MFFSAKQASILPIVLKAYQIQQNAFAEKNIRLQINKCYSLKIVARYQIAPYI